MNTYRITLGDGTRLENITTRGDDNFVSHTELSERLFDGKLDGVNIEYTGDEKEYYPPVSLGMHEHMKLEYCKKIYGIEGWCFVLRDYTAKELEAMKTEARLSYLEMLIDEGE